MPVFVLMFAKICLPCVASTDKIHTLQWIDAYPDAKAYVCPGGMKKYPDVSYTQVSTNLCHMHIDVPSRAVKVCDRLWRSIAGLNTCFVMPCIYIGIAGTLHWQSESIAC